MASSYVTRKILETHDIVQFLHERGIEPVFGINGRYKYKCPIHHDEDPSFNVFPPEGEEKFSNFYCFGCKNGGNIINLKMRLDGVEARDAIKALAEGIESTPDDEVNYIVTEMEKSADSFQRYTPDDLNLLISRQIHDFLKGVKHEQPYFHRCELLLKTLDDAVLRCDVPRAEQIYEMLEGYLDKQREEWERSKDKSEEDLAQTYAGI